MSELTWYLAQWFVYGFVVVWLLVKLDREREQHQETRGDVEKRERHLFECAVQLRAARSRGLTLLPHVDGLVQRYLRLCPNAADRRHWLNDDRPSCRLCGLCLDVELERDARKPGERLQLEPVARKLGDRLLLLLIGRKP
jgi:hypothetical protein